MRIAVLFGLLAGACAAATPGPKDKPPPKNPLVGEWELVPGGPPGSGVTITFTPDGKLKFDDGKTAPEWGWYRADPAKDPPEVDYATPAVAKPNSRRQPHLGIYRADGDTLTIFSTPGGGTRPPKFEAPRGSGVMQLNLRRVKKD